jgi:hypothetical protein
MSLHYNTRKIFFNMEENLTYISGFTADIFISAPRYVRVNQSFVLKCSSYKYININYIPTTTSIVTVFETEM